MKWLRLYNDTITDPKWRVVAAESGQPLTAVLAVWMSMLVCASDADERGTLQGWDDRFAGAALDLRGDAVRAIREAMQGIVLDGMRLSGWDKRQRASDNIAERVKRHRTKAKETPPDGGSTNGTGQHRNDTKAKGNGDVTLQKRNCTDFSLDLSYLPSNPTTLNNSGGGGAGAREVGEMVAGKTGLKVQACVDRAAKWIAAGYDPGLDILPTVDDLVRSAKEPIGTPQYFDRAIRRRHDARMAPLPDPLPHNVSYLPGAGGRPSREDPAIARLRARKAEEQAKADQWGVL
jgi:hypothetical protein